MPTPMDLTPDQTMLSRLAKGGRPGGHALITAILCSGVWTEHRKFEAGLTLWEYSGNGLLAKVCPDVEATQAMAARAVKATGTTA